MRTPSLGKAGRGEVLERVAFDIWVELRVTGPAEPLVQRVNVGRARHKAGKQVLARDSVCPEYVGGINQRMWRQSPEAAFPDVVHEWASIFRAHVTCAVVGCVKERAWVAALAVALHEVVRKSVETAVANVGIPRQEPLCIEVGGHLIP